MDVDTSIVDVWYEKYYTRRTVEFKYWKTRALPQSLSTVLHPTVIAHCKAAFEWNHPRQSNRTYYTLPVGYNWHDGGTVCVLDCDYENFPLFLNTAISMMPLCHHFLALPLTPSVVPLLQNYSIPYVFSLELYLSSKDGEERGCQHPALAGGRMVLLQVLIVELLRAGIPVFTTDADVFHFRSMPNYARALNARGGVRGHTVDVMVASLLDFKPNAYGMWTIDFSPDCDSLLAPKGKRCQFTINNGVIFYAATDAALQVAQDLLEASQFAVLGWIQAGLTLMLKRGGSDVYRHFNRVSSHEYFGHETKTGAGFLVTLGVQHGLGDKMGYTSPSGENAHIKPELNVHQWRPFSGYGEDACFHLHAVGDHSPRHEWATCPNGQRWTGS